MRLMIFVLLGLFFASFASAIILDDCDDNMVAYWQMEGNADDSFGSHDGSGFPGTSVGFIVGNAADFIDGTQMISISDTGQVLDLHGGGGFTIEFWVSKDEFALPSDTFLLNKGNYNIKWTASDEIEATVNGVTITSDPLVPGTSYYIVLTWQLAAENLSLYVNNAVEDSAILVDSGISSDALEIGENFEGLIDEVAFYNTSLGSSTVSSHFSKSGGGLDYCYVAPVGEGGTGGIGVEVTVSGCAFSDGVNLAPGTCSQDGYKYCGGSPDLKGYNTMDDMYGCSLGDEDGYTSGARQCCPQGYLCDLDEEDPLTCVLVLDVVDCTTFSDSGACSTNGCFWLGGEEGCVDNPREYSCSSYNLESDCVADVWNLGREGVGSEVCGTGFFAAEASYFVPFTLCGCVWAEEKCSLKYTVETDFYSTEPSTNYPFRSFNCSTTFDVGDCLDGERFVSWNASAIENSTSFSADQSAVVVAAGCVSGSWTRFCGQPLTKLPGFSLFALISSLGFIGMFYFFREKKKL